MSQSANSYNKLPSKAPTVKLPSIPTCSEDVGDWIGPADPGKLISYGFYRME